ncbi:MAG: response regulator transcription factor [Acidobacteriota bacterium]
MDVIKVLLVDDHALFRSGVAGLLAEQPGFEVVGEAADGKEALQKATELMPDIILMDVYMPGTGGLEATRNIKKELPYVKVVMLTVSEEDKDLFEAIKAGAQGYLLKKIDPKEFFRTLRAAFNGEAPMSRATAAKILGEFNRLASGNGKGNSPNNSKVSPREREVLELLTKGSTNKEIASSLYISENTVKNHLKNILEKLHLKNRVEAVTYALREGLVEDVGSRA